MQIKDSYYITKAAFGSFLKTLNAEAFLNLPAQRFIWGYDDDFFSLAKAFMSLKKPMPYDKFGLLAHVSSSTMPVLPQGLIFW